ncbi:hypothetical protein, partial [Escherichia coli]
FSKGYFGFDILGAIPFHRPTKWVQYNFEAEPVFFCMTQSSKFFATSQHCHNLSHCKSSQIASGTISSPSPKKRNIPELPHLAQPLRLLY